MIGAMSLDLAGVKIGLVCRDHAVRDREFWVSTGVDLAVSVAVGVAAAAVVAGAVALLAPALPVLAVPAVAIGLTAVAGIGIGALIEAVPLPGMDKPLTEWAKIQLNGLLSGE